MRSVIVVFATILAGCLSNATTEDVVMNNGVYEREVGSELPITLLTLLSDVNGCYLDTPSGTTIEFKPVDSSSDKYELRTDTTLSQCSVTILNIDHNDVGQWRLRSEDANGSTIAEETFTISVPSAAVDESAVVDESAAVDESADVGDEHFEEEAWSESYLTAERFEASMGEIVYASIPLVGAYETHSCFIRTPNGTDYNLENIELPGVVRHVDSSISCGVSVNLVTADFVGDWILASRELAWGSDHVERRLPFTIYVEEFVNTSPKEEGTVVAGNDFYLHLEEATDLHDTCRFVGPNGDSSARVELDTRYTENCGIIIKNVQLNDAGKWEIVYGNNIIYRTIIQLDVHDIKDDSTAVTESLSLTLDMPVNETLLPANAIYCLLEDPTGYKVFEGFGPCQLVLPRATSEHAGVWSMKIGVSGKVLMQEHRMFVSVIVAAKAVVTTHVQTTKPSVYLSCSVSSPAVVKACKFRAPNGEVFIASEGVGEDRYTISVANEVTSTGYNYGCELQLGSTLTSDLGLWRCAIETEQEAYYGFLSVLCPWAMQDPTIAAQVEAEPVLKADRQSLTAVEGDHALLSCHAAAPLEYCYLRAPNGTVFSVGSHTSTPAYSYAGAGLDAGECAIRFNALTPRDSGRWSCSAGHGDVEESVNIVLEVHEQMVVSQYLDSSLSLVVTGQVFQHRALDYCRFVRIDGFGFSTDIQHGNPNYEVTGDLSRGECTLRILSSPSILEHHPWTVVARLAGHVEEISAVTPHSIVMPVIAYVRSPTWLPVLLIISLLIIVAGMMMIPKKNREWTMTRATFLRSSVRNSIRKTPLKDVEASNQTPNLPPYAA